MPILNSEIRSYNIIFTGKKERLIQSLQENNLTQYIFLNDLLMVLYVEANFNENIFNNINQIVWWERSCAMSSLINITNNLLQGVPVRQATDMAYMGNNLYNSLEGRGTVIAIIDSGIDYLNQDFLNGDGSSKILYLWDQESNYKSPPEGMLFGSEFTRDEINEAISNNNGDLSRDEIGTGTVTASIAVSQGKNNINYKGIAPKAELIVVKLRSYISLFKEGRINYQNTDFLVAISYIIKKFKEINRPIILNFTVGTTSGRDISQALLNTFSQIPGITEISINPYIGTILIKYEEETIQPMLIIGIILKVLGLEDEAHNENRSLVTKESIDILDSLSHTIYEKTNGILDLKSSVMLLLGTYAVYDIKTRPGVRPAGITCLWWLYGLINRPN